jgi:hypothetical protein
VVPRLLPCESRTDADGTFALTEAFLTVRSQVSLKALALGMPDVRDYRDAASFAAGFPAALATGARVLRASLGSRGEGVWRVEVKAGVPGQVPQLASTVRVQEAADNHVEELPLGDFITRCCSCTRFSLEHAAGCRPRRPVGTRFGSVVLTHGTRSCWSGEYTTRVLLTTAIAAAGKGEGRQLHSLTHSERTPPPPGAPRPGPAVFWHAASCRNAQLHSLIHALARRCSRYLPGERDGEGDGEPRLLVDAAHLPLAVNGELRVTLVGCTPVAVLRRGRARPADFAAAGAELVSLLPLSHSPHSPHSPPRPLS